LTYSDSSEKEVTVYEVYDAASIRTIAVVGHTGSGRHS